MNTEFLIQTLNAGLMISIIGMGVVMLFLTLMMGIMRITEKVMAILAVWFPEEVKEEPKKNVKSSSDNELAIAIAAARNFLIKGGN
ncbi:TPA: OadG family protein [Candidatus Avigastranaerophilus faecigallinarum]|nr:OadG family protein [Candidatus Avigastranaerophilus faecigallinarum]